MGKREREERGGVLEMNSGGKVKKRKGRKGERED